MSARHFEDKNHTVCYKAYRPTYPTALKKRILDYVKEVNPSCAFESMLDVGCGSGQATLMWKDDFKTIHGTDISEEQINQAPGTYSNVSFSVGSGEKLDFADGSMDLITVAQALHWMDVEKLYTEAKRVLKRGGVLAAFGYNYSQLMMDNEEANEVILHEFETKHLRAGGHWARQRAYAVNNYSAFTFPLHHFKRRFLKRELCIGFRELISCSIEDWSVDQVVGLLSSLSGYQSYLAAHPSSTLLADTRCRLEDIYKERQLKITIPIFLLLGHTSK